MGRRMETHGAYAGRTVEQRRADRRRRLIDAAFDIAGREGVAAVKVRALCEHAGLNDRYFYEHFRTVDELLVVVFEDQAAAAVTAVLDAILHAPVAARPRVAWIVNACLDHILGDPRRGRFLVESQATQPLRDKRAELIQLLSHMLIGQTRDVLGADLAEDRKVQFAAHTVTAGVIDLTSTWLAGKLDTDRDELAEFVTAMILTSSEITGILERELAEPADAGH
ncbi:TetR/AcrR family transcriptional regulator [Nocardia neocaledoniensis]|uniref:TetR/AcrR family transcriptional regulator n=1 Tax=Nocardia neocaledoniensis TaxID=236511 RepID=UPI00245542C2|nr:TetR/AcrR family transcriptional regulator [Nocardia neocaledoniensis]